MSDHIDPDFDPEPTPPEGDVTIYVAVAVVQRNYPPVIGAYRDRATAIRYMDPKDGGKLYAVSDPTDAILKGHDWTAFDDRDEVYVQLLGIIRGVPVEIIPIEVIKL